MATPPSTVPFVKMQGVGNDFVVVDAGAWPEDTAWPARAVVLCARRTGIGGDGLLVVASSAIADVRMRMFNPDGTEDMCGNGLRCVVRFAHERGYLGTEGVVETRAGLRRIWVHGEGTITAEMGVPRFSPAGLPMNVSGDGPVLDFPLVVDGETIPVSVVSTGSTHTVIWRDALPGDAEFLAWSPQIENHPFFPERTSVLWAAVDGPDSQATVARLRLRIWERGVGETLGCGTGACAAAVLARVQSRASAPEIEVISKGGALRVAWPGGMEDPILLTGPAEVVYYGIWPS